MEKIEYKNDSQARLQALGELIREGVASNQEELCKALKQKKFKVTQSTISRDLRRIGAIKTTSPDGEVTYYMPDEAQAPVLPPRVSNNLGQLMVDIESNSNMIVIHTTPGSASLVARHIDSMRSALGILGTIAGDDTIFIAPANTKAISSLIKKIEAEF